MPMYLNIVESVPIDGGFKSAYYIVPLKAKTIEQQPQSLYSPSYGTGIHLRTI